jgi:hypothetical protein
MRKPKPAQVRKMMLRRCQWLVQRLEQDLRTGVRVPDGSWFLDELAATIVVMESYEREQASREFLDALRWLREHVEWVAATSGPGNPTTAQKALAALDILLGERPHQ